VLLLFDAAQVRVVASGQALDRHTAEGSCRPASSPSSPSSSGRRSATARTRGSAAGHGPAARGPQGRRSATAWAKDTVGLWSPRRPRW
jgi:hypothetical protein